jgi:hypothetical protein
MLILHPEGAKYADLLTKMQTGLAFEDKAENLLGIQADLSAVGQGARSELRAARLDRRDAISGIFPVYSKLTVWYTSLS